MSEAIYYSKIEYRQFLGCFREEFRLLVDLANREIIYQEFEIRLNMPSSTGIQAGEEKQHIYDDTSFPLRKMGSGKTDFKSQMIREEEYEKNVSFVAGIKLTDEEYDNLLPYCNALDFEPYRDKKMSMNDPGFIGYRDEIDLYFSAVTDSYIPKLDICMRYYYDKQHIWPTERLHLYLVNTFFKNSSKLKKCRINSYGGNSLFFC